MNLATAIRIFADADNISTAVRKVFNKRTGKQRGYDSIAQEIRDKAKSEAELYAGPLDKNQEAELNSYISHRLDFMRNTFKQLNSSMKNKSDERAQLVGDTEDNAAKWFGRTKGHEWSRRPVTKSWVAGADSCQTCLDNEDQGPIPVSDDFQSGDYAPGAHVNCDCDLEYNEDEE